jgi:hypothetical protein
VRQRQHLLHRRQRAVKRGVEARDLRQVGHIGQQGLDRLQRERLVQRRQRDKPFRSARTSWSTRTGAAYLLPPCTTRCTTAVGGLPPVCATTVARTCCNAAS